MNAPGNELYGLLAKFSTPEALVEAARRTTRAGYRRVDAYTPFPVEGLYQALRLRSSPLPFVILAGGIAGALTGFLMQTFANVVDLPLNIGGRPLFSWPAYIPITFELTILFAAGAGILGLFYFTRFPEPYHPVFNVEDFQEHGSQDGFYLSVEAKDPRFDLVETRKFLEDLDAVMVAEIEA
ncbi:MAG TPA: DUF3341 domain-containing protein [Anaerolineaceae bacterium]|nr:DUF3341 domain-containing protein [Anaerolineaceae bacterium]